LGETQNDNSPNRKHVEFFVTNGEDIKLIGKGIYFLRCLPPGEPVKITHGEDDTVCFGEINDNSINILSNLINNVFKPQIYSMVDADWEQCTEENRKDFTVHFEKFAKELLEAQRTLIQNVTL